MRSRVTLGKYIVYCILVTMLVYIITNASMGYLAFSLDGWTVIGIAVLANVLLFLIYSFPIIGFGLAALIPASSLVYFVFWKDSFLSSAGYVIDFISGSAAWFYEYIFNPIGVNLPYMKFLVIVFAILLTVLLFNILIIRHYVVLTLFAGVVYISFMWYFGYNDAFMFVQLFVYICFALYGFTHFDKMETGWKLKRDRYSKKIAVTFSSCIVIFLGVIFILVGILPNKINAVSIQWLNENVFSAFSGYGSRGVIGKGYLSDRFSISSVGFPGGASRLGGSVKMSDKLLLKVKIEGSAITPLYLRGAIRDNYTGSMWTKSNPEGIELPSIAGPTGFTGDDSKVSDVLDAAITVYPQFKTVTIFNLWKPERLQVDTESYRITGDGELYFNSKDESIKEYTVISKIPNIYADSLRESGNETSIDEVLKPYLQIPEEMPARVITLTHTITDKYSTSYDKAMAIQSYLRTAFPYTLNTTELPEGRDFVDYFLFNEKKGYCTYYASAMAMMSRLVGIPSRYVEGFVINSVDKDANGLYNIRSSQAHAWVELYFKGYGWVNFEPTSAYVVTNYERVSVTPEQVPTYNPSSEVLPENTKRPGGKQLDDFSDPEGISTPVQELPWRLYAAIALAALIVARILFKIYISRRRLKKADNLKGKDAAMEYFSLLEERLKCSGFVRYAGETPSEFGDRIYGYMDLYNIDSREFSTIFNRIRFGNSGMDSTAREKFKRIIKAADRLFRDRKGIIKYAAKKYLL